MKNNTTNILLFLILLGIAWIIWKPLFFLIIIGFVFYYWFGSRVDIFMIGGIKNPKEYEHPEDLLRCKICKICFHKDHFSKHILDMAIKEQEVINEMPFLSFMMAKNRHKEYFKEAISQIQKAGGQYEIDNEDGTKTIVKGRSARLVQKINNKVIKKINL